MSKVSLLIRTLRSDFEGGRKVVLQTRFFRLEKSGSANSDFFLVGDPESRISYYVLQDWVFRLGQDIFLNQFPLFRYFTVKRYNIIWVVPNASTKRIKLVPLSKQRSKRHPKCIPGTEKIRTWKINIYFKQFFLKLYY